MSGIESSTFNDVGSLAATLQPNQAKIAQERATEKIRNDLEAIENKPLPAADVKQSVRERPEPVFPPPETSPADALLEQRRKAQIQDQITPEGRLVESELATLQNGEKTEAAEKFLEAFQGTQQQQGTFVNTTA